MKPDNEEVRFQLWLIVTWLILIALVTFPLWVSKANAFDMNFSEIKISIGNNHSLQDPKGSWDQTPLPYTFDKNNFTWSIGGTWRTPISWLDVSAEYADRGKFTGGGENVSDPCFATSPGFTHSECSMRFESKISGTTKAIVLTLDPTYHGNNWSVGAQLGASFFHSTFQYEWLPVGDCANRPCAGAKFTKDSVSPYISIQGSYESMYMVVYLASMERAPESLSPGNYGVRVGIKHSF